MVRITYDPRKRVATLRDRDIDFEDAGEVFAESSSTFRTSVSTTAKSVS